jgi:xylulokinase
VTKQKSLFLGIDCGTGGVRALVASATGEIAAQCSAALSPAASTKAHQAHEQQPQAWWECVCRATNGVVAQLKAASLSLDCLAAVAVDGTSGTVVCVDGRGTALRPAIMYNDGRSADEAEEINALAGAFCDRLGYRFNASFALPKILWLQRHEPEVFGRAAHCIHHADFVLGRLSGNFAVSDYSNALKTGYDLVDERWPDWLDALAGVRDRLPRIVPPGTVMGAVRRSAALEAGLPEDLPVVTGASDGTAAFLASGARLAGQVNTTLGTTLVFKQLSQSLCRHPGGLVYSHKLPGGWWLPGAASNVGAAWIQALFPGDDVPALDAAASRHLPNEAVAYPLVGNGERFPFVSPRAEGFCSPESPDKAERFAAHLQGTALVERLCYRVLDEMTGNTSAEVFSTGGGSSSDVWMQCRADATNRTFHRPLCPESAFGSAVLAAVGAFGSGLMQTVQEMVRIERSFSPDPRFRGRYDDLFGRFKAELERRGYR